MSRALFCSRWLWSAVFLILAVLQVAHRTPPVRVDSFFFDFSNVYSASRAWLHGHDAYRLPAVFAEWDASNHGPYLGTTRQAGMQTWAAVYPPSSLLMLSPLAAMDAVPAHLLWMGLNFGLLGLAFAALFELANLKSWSLRLLLVAGALASAPVQGAIGSGQPALPACTLLVLAVWAYSRNLITLGGILLGTAAAIKIQIGGPFLVYYLFLRQWRLVSIATLLVLSVTLLSIVRLEVAGVGDWASNWHQNVAATLEPGQINDPRPGGPFRNDMVNLQTILSVPVHRDAIVSAGVVILVLPIVTIFLGLVRRNRSSGFDLLKLSIVGLISMLPLYHRLYDGVMLVMLLAWALGQLDSGRRSVGLMTLAAMAELLVPIDLVPAVMRRTHAFDGVVNSGVWQGLVIPHHAWGILLVTVSSLAVLWRLHEPRAVGVALVEKSKIPASPRSV